MADLCCEVGRTGSGKSSLTLSLLRLIPTEGKVYYDGIATDFVNLDALRSHITIIPQVVCLVSLSNPVYLAHTSVQPELLSGTLRQNLDPFTFYDDVVLNDALRAAGLFSLQSETDEGRITLDSQISSGGSNLSVGQRQILALARAIVRQSKLLILDEGMLSTRGLRIIGLMFCLYCSDVGDRYEFAVISSVLLIAYVVGRL